MSILKEVSTVHRHKATRKEITVIAISIAGAFLAMGTQTILTPALPKLMEAFAITPGTAQWVMSIYLLTNGIMVPITGFLIDRFSTRKLFMASMVVFIVGTLICAVAPNFGVLIAGRVLQAAGAGVQLPLMAVLPMVIFPPERRGTVMGIVGVVMSCAPAFGPVAAGAIIDTLGWRSMFWALIPLAFIVLAVSFFLLSNVGELKKPHLDVPSVALSTIAFGGLLLGFSNTSTLSWVSPLVILPIIAGALSFAWFVRRQLTIDEPLLELRVLKRSVFAYATIILTIINASLSVGMVILPLYLQSVLGLSAFETGMLMMPGAFAGMFCSPLSGVLFDKFGPRALALIGLSGLTGSMAALAFIGPTTATWYLIAAYVIQSAGLTLATMPVMTWGLNSLDNDKIAHGNAILNTSRQVGGAISTALIVSIMTTVASANASAGPVISTAIGIDVAYGVSAAIAGAGLVFAIFKVRARKNVIKTRGASSIELVSDTAAEASEREYFMQDTAVQSNSTPTDKRSNEFAKGATR